MVEGQGKEEKQNNLSKTETLRALMHTSEASRDKHEGRKPAVGLAFPCLHCTMNYHYSGIILVSIRATFISLDRLSLSCSLQKGSE